jgi:uncharacterized hydrophobic protein (TIGR00271 family)
MRHLLVQVPADHGKQVLKISKEYHGQNPACWPGQDQDGNVDLISVSIPNRGIQPFLEKLQDLPEVRITFAPQGVLALRPPATETPEQVTNVEDRSPIEVFLSGLQSIGSWRGFVGYAIAAGFTAWIGLFTDTVYMLIAAMLIAPFAGPAMNLAVATAHGDLMLLRRSLLRYFAALSIGIVVAGLLSFGFQQDVATMMMISVAKVSVVAVLIPLVAGAAGAVNLMQSERNSLVSGAATGMLVAAALAPPAALVGMATVTGQWPMVTSALFLLLLQLFGIHLSGSLVFRYYGGMKSQESRYQRGKPWVFPVSLVVSTVALAALLFWQFTGSPDLYRSTQEQRARAVVQEILADTPLGMLVDADVRFTRPDVSEQNTLLAVIYVQRAAEIDDSPEQIDLQLTGLIEDRLRSEFDVTPLVDLSVLIAPGEKRNE